MAENNALKPLHKIKKMTLLLVSLIIVAWGQPTSSWWIGALSAILGFSLYFRVLLDESSRKMRFWLGTLWFGGVQLVQLYWLTSHPYNYIYAVYFAFALLWGFQWGIFSLFITSEHIKKISHIVGLACLWTLFEWLRLFFLSGYSWNPVGLALSGQIYSLQMASLAGVFGLSFLVQLTNLSGLRSWLLWPHKKSCCLTAMLIAMPYLFGYAQLKYHDSRKNAHEELLKALLVQTAFPAEEALTFHSTEKYVAFVSHEWQKILNILQKYQHEAVDIIALPEYVVPFGTYSCLYPYTDVSDAFVSLFGSESLKKLPPLKEPFASMCHTAHGSQYLVNNAFWVQAIANIFQSEVIIGLEDADEDKGQMRYYSAALHFKPNATAANFNPVRYAKRVLLPMAEYIPGSIFKELAASYGIASSFTPGSEAIVMHCGKVPFGVSICYEETFGNIIRQSRQAGAHVLINLTSDVWYPNSALPKQHQAHARLRTVENGTALLRACNTGVTCAFDSFGQHIASLGDDSPASEWLADALYVKVSTYHYSTLYAHTGDSIIVAFCFIGLLPFWPRRRKHKF